MEGFPARQLKKSGSNQISHRDDCTKIPKRRRRNDKAGDRGKTRVGGQPLVSHGGGRVLDLLFVPLEAVLLDLRDVRWNSVSAETEL